MIQLERNFLSVLEYQIDPLQNGVQSVTSVLQCCRRILVLYMILNGKTYYRSPKMCNTTILQRRPVCLLKTLLEFSQFKPGPHEHVAEVDVRSPGIDHVSDTGYLQLDDRGGHLLELFPAKKLEFVPVRFWVAELHEVNRIVE